MPEPNFNLNDSEYAEIVATQIVGDSIIMKKIQTQCPGYDRSRIEADATTHAMQLISKIRNGDYTDIGYSPDMGTLPVEWMVNQTVQQFTLNGKDGGAYCAISGGKSKSKKRRTTRRRKLGKMSRRNRKRA